MFFRPKINKVKGNGLSLKPFDSENDVTKRLCFIPGREKTRSFRAEMNRAA